MTRFWNPRKAALQAGAAPRALFDDAVMMLEDRVMLDATPVVTVDAPTNVFLKSPGATFTATILFDNSGTDPGYGPFVELIVPQNGADGAGVSSTNNDGVTFNGATYLGQAVTSFSATIDAAGNAVNGLTGETVNVGAGNAGQQFVVLQLPFGSFTGPQTPTAITANFTLSPNADLGTALTIQGRGGFQFGLDPLNNPGTDPIIRQAGFGSDTVTPNLVAITKTSTVPNDKEAEVATGPNQPYSYTITVDIADGQTLTNLVIADVLPSTFFYQGLDSVVVSGGAGFSTSGITANTLVGTGGQNTLSVTIPTVSAALNSTSDVTITFHGYVNDVRADTTSVISPTTGAITNTDNNVQASYRWTPLDPLDQPTPLNPPTNFVSFLDNPAGPENTLQNQPIVIQKTGAIATNTGPAGLNPGDTIEYTLNIQVSDYFSVGDISLNDVLGDGQRLDTAFLPTIALVQRGVTSATVALPGTSAAGGEFTGTFASSFSAATGLTTSTINLSTALTTGGTPLDADGVLAGGRTQPGDVGANTGGTTVQIKFRAVVQNNFEDDLILAQNRAVDQGDQVGNTVTISGSIRSNTSPTMTIDGIALRDDGDAFLPIAKGSLAKTIYAINGDTNLANFTIGGNLQLKAGDLITYRLQYQLPITSFQDFTITDFLPLPVVKSDANPIVFNPGAPTLAAGELVFGPADTFAPLLNSPNPTTSISASGAGNSITIAFANYSLQDQGLPNQASTIDLLLTVQAQDTQFANGLFLTNLATSSESNTVSNATQDNSIIKIQLAQPNLLIQKAYVTTSRGTIGTPALSVAGVTFGAPGTATSFTGTITDLNLGTTAVIAAPNLNSNLSGVDAGDTARVAIVVNNEGRANAFDTTFTDTLPTGVTFLGGSVATANLVVKTGNGTVLAGAGVDYTIVATATGFTITLNDTPTVGKIGRDATDGSDIVVVTYDIAIADAVTIAPTASPLTSSATITKFTATDGSAILQPVNATGQTDPATISLQQPTVTKTLVGGSSTVTSTTEPALTIGEQQTYTVTYTLPEGTTPGVRLLDIVPNSIASGGFYQILSATITSVGTNLKQADGVTAVDAVSIGAAVLSGGNTTATFGGGGFTVVNTSDNANNTAADQIVVTYVVLATNNAGNTQGLAGNNTGRLTYTGSGNINGTSPIGIALPDLTIAKDLTTVGAIDAGDTVSFAITIANPTAPGSRATAYDLALSDILPPTGLTNLALVSVSTTGGLVLSNANFNVAGDTLTSTAPFDLLQGQSFTVNITATVLNSVQAGQTITNSASVTYSTLPGVDPNERTITESDPADVLIAANTATKTLVSTSQAGSTGSNLLIGETATFLISTTLSEGVTNNLVISDLLPSGLVFVSGRVVSIGTYISGSALAAGATVVTPVFNFGASVNDLVNNNPQTIDDQIVVEVVARAANVVGNVNGTVLANGATVASSAGTTTAPNVNTTIIVPDLVITKQNATVGAVDAGDTVTFTINVAHDPASPVAAYGLTVADTLPGSLTNIQLTNVAATGVAVTTANFNVAGNVLTTTTPFDLALGQSFTLTLTGQIAGTPVGGTVISNTASVDYTTLPGVDPNERTISENSTASVTTAATQSLTKTITATTLPGTGIAQYRPAITDLALGETATFEIIATFNEGTTNNVVITDRLPITNGTMQFTATPPSVYIGGVLVALPGGSVTYADLFGGDGINDTIVVNIGAVVLPGDNVAGNNNVRIVYDALLPNLPGNIAGDQLNSQATLTSAIPGAPTASVDIDVVEPVLQIDKNAVAATVASGAAASYTIAVSHTGASTSTAYDLDLGDILPAGLTNLQVTGVGTGGGLVLSTANFTTAGNTLNFVTPLDLALGQSFTVTVSATTAGAAGTVLTNTASVDYSSFDGVSATERTSSVNDTAVVTLLPVVIPPPPPPPPPVTQSFTKAVVATSVAATGDGQYRAGVPDLTIGETATFELVGTFTATTVNNLVITDQLPLANGTMTFSGTPTLLIGGVATPFPGGSISYADSDGDGINDRVVFALGNVTLPSGDLTVRIRYDALLPNLPSNAAGDQLASPATLTSALGGPLAASVDLDVVAPDLTIAKDVVGAGTILPGATATFTIALGHSGISSANAYDLALADALPAGLTDLAVTGVTASGGLVLSTADFTTAGNMLGFASPVDLLLSQSFVVTLTGRTTAPAGTILTNTAAITFSTLDGDFPTIERSTTLTDPASVTVLSGVFALDKAITATGSPDTGTAQVTPGAPDLAIGETVTFTLTIAVPAGSNPLILTDRLSDVQGSLQLIGTPVVTPGAGVTIGNVGFTQPDLDGDGTPDLRFDFGTVTSPAGGVITITYTARVPDLTVNAAGDSLLLPAVLTTPTGTLTDSERVDIVEPRLAITKAVAGANFDAGDVVGYTVQLTNSGTGPAYNVALGDVLPGGLSYVGGSAFVTAGGVTSAVASPGAVTLGRLLPGETATLTYQAVIAPNALTGATLTNIVTATFDASGGIRPGSVTANAGLLFGAQALTKAITATSNAETGIAQVRPTVTDLGIGETVTFDLRVGLSEGVTRNVIVTDTLNVPAGVLTLTGTPQILLNGILTTLPDTVQTIDTNGDGVPDQIRFNLGDVTLPANNNPNDNFLIIRYTAIVPNVAQNVGGDQLDLPATLTSILGTASATASVDIVEPVLLLTKIVATDQPANGTDPVYLLTLGHAANSLSSATAITIQDLLPPGQFLIGAPTIVQGPAGVTVNGTAISVPHLSIGETVTIRLATSIDIANIAGGSVINRASVTYGGTSYTTGSRQGTGAAEAPAIFLAGTTQLPGISSGMFDRHGTIGNRFERQYRPIFPQIDPIYSGQSDPGSTVTLGLTGPNGLSTGYGSALVDAGGNWIITMPSSTVNELLERSRLDSYFDSSRLFSAPAGSIFNDRDLFGFDREDQTLSVGSTPSFDPQLGRLTTSGGSAGLGAGFIPTWRSQTFTIEPALDIDGVFQHRAQEAVEGLYDYLAAPEAAGLNRFNTAFLTAGAG